jgi:hypothetical protein
MSKIRLSSDGATQAQVKANRQNAQKSTGPKTAEGKAAVSQNAVKHGLFAMQDVLSVENQAEFDQLREQMLAELAPVGGVETLLAQRAVSLAWRLRRAETMQNQVIEYMIDSYAESQRRSWGSSPSEPRNSVDFLPLGRIASKDWSNSRVIEHLLIYERRIENSLYRTIAKLRAVQLMRQIEQTGADETQSHTKADAKENSVKQSQSVRAKSFSEELPDRSSPDPKDISSFIEDTFGDNPPLWAQATLRRLSNPHVGGSVSPDRRKPIPGRQTHGNGKKRNVPLSLLRL